MSAPDTLELPPRPEAVTQALGWLETLAEAHAWPVRLTLALTLSTDEALTNVLRYAFSGSPPTLAPRIRLEHTRLPDGVCITLIDNGLAFDPTAVAEPETMASIEQARVGGRGLQLMRHYLRRLHYSRQGDENHLRLEAAWPAG